MAKDKKLNPRDRVTKSVYQRALSGVNRIRKANGLKPLGTLPYGVPRDTRSCPLAVALKPAGVTDVGAQTSTVEVVTKTLVEAPRGFGLTPGRGIAKGEITSETVIVANPEAFVAFTEAFDKGK